MCSSTAKLCTFFSNQLTISTKYTMGFEKYYQWKKLCRIAFFITEDFCQNNCVSNINNHPIDFISLGMFKGCTSCWTCQAQCICWIFVSKMKKETCFTVVNFSHTRKSESENIIVKFWETMWNQKAIGPNLYFFLYHHNIYSIYFIRQTLLGPGHEGKMNMYDFWTRRNLNTWRKSMQTRGKHVNSKLKDSRPKLDLFEATVLATNQ